MPRPQHPEFHSQGPAQTGHLTVSTSSQQALSLVPFPSQMGCSFSRPAPEMGEERNPVLPATANPLLPMQGSLDLIIGVGGMGASGG